MYNEFEDDSTIKVERTRPDFKIHQLKIERFHFNSGDLHEGMPISTSIELKSEYENNESFYTKTISHTYYGINKISEIETDTYTERLDNYEEIISEIEKYDLRKLKNNYFTEEGLDRFRHWEITYNYYFKIVGTYDQTIEAYDRISDLLDFKHVVEEEVRKVEDKVRNNE